MAIMHEQITFPVESSIILRRKLAAHFTFPYHYHKVYELVYVEEGYGTRYMGNNIEPFGAGDLVLVGPNTPHCWESDKKFYMNNPELLVKGIVVQWPGDFFMQQIYNYPEFTKIKELLHQTLRGVLVIGSTRDKVVERLNKMFKMSSFERILEFVKILHFVAEKEDYRMLAGEDYNPRDLESGRLKKVMDYIYNNYNQKIMLDEVSSIAGLTKSGFCVWFKKSTSKRFSDFVNEIRIANCCEILRSAKDTHSISQVGYLCGFENLSNFNRKFKKLTGVTPREYRSSF